MIKDLENTIAMAQVLSFRVPMLWTMAFSPTAERRAEAVKMIVEKQMAMMDGMNAVALSALASWMKLMSGQAVSADAAGQKMIRAAVRQGQRRVRANARRLKRRKRI